MSMVASKGFASAALGVIRASEAPQPIRMAIELRSPVEGLMLGYVDANRVSDPARMVTPDKRVGYTLALCGAGPSLASAQISGVDAVWACNSALPYLTARGIHVDVGIGIDQTPGLVREWADAPDVPYYLASSCDPALVAHLESQGRTVSFFHNAVGLANEFQHYCATWPPTLMVGEGFTVVSRAIGLALWMGYERVDVYGADCAFADNDIAHANGDAAEAAYRNPLIMSGEVNGRTWRTRPDMLMDAVHLVRRVRRTEGRVRLLGDTMPVALLGKDDAFLDSVCRFLPPGTTPDSLPNEVPDGLEG